MAGIIGTFSEKQQNDYRTDFLTLGPEIVNTITDTAVAKYTRLQILMRVSVLNILPLFLSCNKRTAERSVTSEVGKPAIPIAALPKLYVNYFRDALYQGISDYELDSILGHCF